MSCPDQGSTSYRAVLALPHARRLFAAALLARLGYGLVGLPLLIALRQGTGSYAVAGPAISLYGLAVAVLGPARARLVDRRPGSLTLLAAGYAAALCALAACVRRRGPGRGGHRARRPHRAAAAPDRAGDARLVEPPGPGRGPAPAGAEPGHGGRVHRVRDRTGARRPADRRVARPCGARRLRRAGAGRRRAAGGQRAARPARRGRPADRPHQGLGPAARRRASRPCCC